MTTLPKKITAAAFGIAAMTGCSTSDPDTTTSTPPSATASPVSPAVSPGRAGRYADGRYTATGWYGGLPSSIDVTEPPR